MNDSCQDPHFVLLGDRPLEVGRSSTADLRLYHPTVSRNHATVSRSDKGIMIVDRDSRYGTFVNGMRIRSISIRPGDRIQFGSVTVYRVHENCLKLDGASHGIRLSARGLNIAKGGKRLIENASFFLDVDAFVGILGPSGAGKSTLLNCLASYQQMPDGQLVFDEQFDVNARRDEYRSLLGHVPQEDIVYPALTVRENLYFAARLRLAACAGDGEIDDAVRQALERVGLTEHQAKTAAILSGGQCKRLSVAVELLKRPRLLLLDEPTSGLDPAGEANLMEQLRYVASRGTTVVCTTHLMENVRLLDTVIVLGVVDGMGRIGYVGPPMKMLEFFGCRHFADLYEKLSAGRFLPLAAAADDESPPTIQMDTAEPTSRFQGMPKSQSNNLPPNSALSNRLKFKDLIARTMEESIWRQSLTVCRRDFLNIGRDRGLWIMMLAQPLILGLLVSLIQFDPDKLRPVFFFVVVISIWLGLNNSARDLVRERKHYVRERLAGLRPEAFLAAKATLYIFIGCLQVLLLLIVIRMVCGLVMPESAMHDLRKLSLTNFFVSLMLTYSCGLGLGLLTSTLARTEEAAVAALPLLIMPQLLLSALATGKGNESYENSQMLFQPLVVMLRSSRELPAADRFVDYLSLFCYSRPGTLVSEAPKVIGFNSWVWCGDMCHLMILLLGTWTLLYLAFLRSEPKWPRLIGLG